MFSLSLRERVLVAAILLAVLLGVTVKHWRDARREAAAALPAEAAAAHPSPGRLAQTPEHAPQP